MPTIADRFFANQIESAKISDELFDAIQLAFGLRPVEECAAKDFVFACEDFSGDDYDYSLEIVQTRGNPPVTAEIAIKLRDLGFGIIFVSRDGECRAWTRQGKDSIYSGNALEARGNSARAIARLRARITELESERNEAFSYINSIWRNNQLPSPMDNKLYDALVRYNKR